MAILGGVSQISDGDSFEEEILDDDEALGELEEITVDDIAEELSEEIPQDEVFASDDEVALEEESPLTDGYETTSTSGGRATDEAAEEGEASLDDLTLVDLPVTIAKGDGEEGEECSADDVEAISLDYTEDNVMRRRMRGLGSIDSPLAGQIFAGILSAAAEGLSGTGAPSDAVVFLLPEAISLGSEGDGEFSVETCEVFSDDEEGLVYRWTALSPEDLTGLQLETGHVGIGLQKALVRHSGSILEFTGVASRFRLNAADFGDETPGTTPFIILR